MTFAERFSQLLQHLLRNLLQRRQSVWKALLWGAVTVVVIGFVAGVGRAGGARPDPPPPTRPARDPPPPLAPRVSARPPLVGPVLLGRPVPRRPGAIPRHVM